MTFKSFTALAKENGTHIENISNGFEKGFSSHMQSVIRDSARNDLKARQSAASVMLTR